MNPKKPKRLFAPTSKRQERIRLGRMPGVGGRDDSTYRAARRNALKNRKIKT